MKLTTLKRLACLSLCLVMLLGLFSGAVSAMGPESDVQYIPAQTKSPVTDLIEAMKAEIDALPTAGALRNGRIRLSGFTQSADGSNEVKELRGKHYLVHGENNNHYIIDGSWTGTNGEVAMKIGTHVDGNAAYFTANASPTMAFEFHYKGLSSNGMPLYVLRFNNGRNLAVGSKYTNWNNLYYVKGDTTADLNSAPQVRFEHPNGVNWVRISNAAGTHGFRQASDLSYIRWKDNSAGDNDYAGNAMFLYRIWSTREILTAIRDMRSYLDTPEFFDDAVLGELLVYLREAIDLFRQYNSWPTSLVDPYDFIQEKLDAKEAELRSFTSRLAFDFKEPSAASLNAKTTIHQLPLACGYVIQTREGKIIIIDGGWQENNTEGTYLFQYLQKITGKTKPHIDAWFITHAHADHHGCVATFANLYKNQVTIDAFYYHYPSYDEIKNYLSGCGVEDTWGAVDWIPSWLLPNFKNAQGGPTKGIHCNTKQSYKCNNNFDFDDVHIEILLTFEDIIWAVENFSGRYSGTSANEGRVFSNKTLRELVNDNFNETSMVFRITVGGKSILFTGDINFVGGQMLNMFHDLNAANPNDFFTLKSDYVQVSHHGHYGLPKNSYYKIDPDVAMWPCNYDEWNDYDYQNLICTKQWFNDMGAKSYVAYQGPHIFEFPLVRSGAAITIPSELKDYVFDAEYYSNKYPDLKELYGNDARQLYYHFVNYGIEEGRCASPFFDVKFYANQNGQRYVDTFKGNYIAAFNEFLSVYNTNTLRRLSENFDTGTYAYYHWDLVEKGINTNLALLKHYVENGYKQGEVATTTFRYTDRCSTYHYNCSATASVAPTCITEGKTSGAWCNTCGLVVKEAQTIPMSGHKEVSTPAVAPDCVNTGLTEGKHCELCGVETLAQTVVPATGHTEVTTSGLAPTCTTEGLTEGTYCSVCNTVLRAQEVIPAAGHKEVIDPEVAPTCRTSGWTEGKHCELCGTVTLAQQVIRATGHSYAYTKLDEQKHTMTCTTCGSTKTEAHSYEDHTCVCGAKLAADPILDSALKLNHSLNLASDIAVNYIVPKTLLAGYDMSTVYVECSMEVYVGEFYMGTNDVKIEPVEMGDYYYFILKGLTAVQMNDTVSTVLYGEKDGQVYYSSADRYCICDYAYSQLNKANSSVALKTLCADLLRYGTKAQIFKGYRTLELADARMTDAHRAYLSDAESVTFGNTNKVLNDLPGATVTWAGKALDLDSKVCLKFIFDPGEYTGDVSDLRLKVSYKNLYGDPMNLTLEAPAVYDASRNLYSFTLDALLVSELREVVSVQIYAGNTPVSATLQYSADTYGNNKKGDLLELCKALIAYSDSAKSFFVAS